MGDRAEQAALGYFMAWIKAMTEGDQFVSFHSRFIDGDNGGIKSVRIKVDGVVLAVIPDPASQAMHKAMAELNDGSSSAIGADEPEKSRGDSDA